MSILSVGFLALAAAVVAVYYMLPLKVRWLALLGGSVFFICLAGWQSAAHLTAAALVLWLGGLGLEALKKRQTAAGAEDRRWAVTRRALLALLLVLDLGSMVLIKYEPAVAAWLNSLMARKKPLLSVWTLAAPLGLSYFTFQSAGMLIDIYRGKAKAQSNPLKAWLFVGYFPQLAQGPISTWRELGGQLLEGHRLDPVGFVSGFQLILWGYFKKLVLADRLAPTTAILLEKGTELPGWLVLGGTALYAVRLYADFSGGMDVVRGLSRMLGIELPENFRRPFFSRSVAEYWRRWHITLGAWFRSYLMYPLTTCRAGIALGRRASKVFGKKTGYIVPTALATFLVFLLIGVWHAAYWTAAAYGAYFGAVMALSMLLEPVWKKLDRALRLPKGGWMNGVRMVRTWLVLLPAQFFAYTFTLDQAAGLMGRSLRGWDFSGWTGRLAEIMAAREWVIAAAAFLVLLAVDIAAERGIDVGGALARARIWVRWPVLLALLLAILVLGVYGPGFDGAAFLYTTF